jgi:hypothetical protein
MGKPSYGSVAVILILGNHYSPVMLAEGEQAEGRCEFFRKMLRGGGA